MIIMSRVIRRIHLITYVNTVNQKEIQILWELIQNGGKEGKFNSNLGTESVTQRRWF